MSDAPNRPNLGAVDTNRGDPFAPGTLWRGKYRLVERLGGGGMGALFLARAIGEAGFERSVALKVLPEPLAQHPTLVEAFVLEARICARLQHPSIVHVYDLEREGNLYFLVMEYVRGHSLSAVLSYARTHRVPLPVDFCVYVVRSILSALTHAHEFTEADGGVPGIIHRDISPSNVLVSNEGQVKLVDFGIAKVRALSGTTKPGTLKGKIGYMAPEALLRGQIDPRYDLWSTGVVLYELLAGDSLFEGTEPEILHQVTSGRIPPLSTRRPDVASPIAKVVARALEADPDQRWATAREMASALAAVHPASPEDPERFAAFVRDLYRRKAFRELVGELEVMQATRTPIGRPSRSRPPTGLRPDRTTEQTVPERIAPRGSTSPPPVRSGTASRPPDPPSRESPADPRILVIDDSDLAREMMIEILREAGFVVHDLPSAIGATREIVQNGISIVIVDVQLPGMRGDRLAALFRTNPSFRRLGLVLVSDLPHEEIRRLAQEVQANAFVPKAELRTTLVPVVQRLTATSVPPSPPPG